VAAAAVQKPAELFRLVDSGGKQAWAQEFLEFRENSAAVKVYRLTTGEVLTPAGTDEFVVVRTRQRFKRQR
jgi:hypothetical protein